MQSENYDHIDLADYEDWIDPDDPSYEAIMCQRSGLAR